MAAKKQAYRRGAHGLLPANEAAEKLIRRLKIGEVVWGNLGVPRNLPMHNKWFVLVNWLHEMWEPNPIQTNDGAQHTPMKSFDRFRKDVIIWCGFHEHHYSVFGGYRLEAKSISFASMGQDEFEELYEATVQFAYEFILDQNRFPRDELDRIVNKLLREFGS